MNFNRPHSPNKTNNMRAEEFIKRELGMKHLPSLIHLDDVKHLMVEFSKIKCEEQLEAVKNNDLENIDSAYPLEDIQ